MYGYPNYQQNYQQNYNQARPFMNQVQNTFTPNNTPQDERIWVQNETSAEAYLLAPNGFVRLWDSSQPRFYEKSADCTGRPMPLKTFEYKEIVASPEPQAMNFVSNEEFTEFKDQVNDFINSLNTKEVKEVKKNVKQSNANDANA